MLASFTKWLADLFRDVFSALWDFLGDILVSIVDTIVGAVLFLVGLIPVPESLAGGMAQLWAQLDPALLYLSSSVGLPAALAILGTGWAFRLGRKLATLGQW
jgi:hypothetical protein